MTKVVEQLKQLQADSHALYVKMHNYHWNVKGMDFFPIHDKTEEIYNSMSELYDDSAERILQLGDKPYITISQLVKASKIKEEEKDTFDSTYVVNNISEDYKYLLTSFRNLSEVAGDVNDKVTEAFADDNIAKLEKEIWMIGNMIK